ncbi:MAG: hypothetical protein HYT69_01130 [Candidatus Zambryskibacteria bacterium]|nr:hypothetical protein [Candidatus Zambryskibacteria bacterium]
MALVSKERWLTLSLAEQLGNIGSEVGRAAKWQGNDEKSFWGAVTRALELFDLTQMDKRWKSRRLELDRAREVFADAVLGGKEYQNSLPDIERYFMQFALLARQKFT